MKTLLGLCASLALALSACEGWPVSSVSYNPPTPYASRTPGILTATPLVVTPSGSPTSPVTPDTPTGEVTLTASPTAATATIVTETPPITPSSTVTPMPTGLQASILGCDTGMDLLHGMGEVTNAYVVITNRTGGDVADLCATLSGLDEGRPHPDKTKCLPVMPSGYKVTLKLTVDTTYQKATPVQVELTAGGQFQMRLGEAACREVSLLPPDMEGLDTPVPAP